MSRLGERCKNERGTPYFTEHLAIYSLRFIKPETISMNHVCNIHDKPTNLWNNFWTCAIGSNEFPQLAQVIYGRMYFPLKLLSIFTPRNSMSFHINQFHATCHFINIYHVFLQSSFFCVERCRSIKCFHIGSCPGSSITSIWPSLLAHLPGYRKTRSI